MLKAENISSYYGNIQALENVSIEVNKGEIEQERPTGYWPIRNESDESVVTIDGDLRRYHVEFGSNPIARDYGIETEIVPLYLEEIKRKL